MKILALETTEKFGSVALLESDHVLAETILPKDRRSSQTLHPALQTLFQKTRLTPQEIDYVAVITGPGSFTGLRVGVTAAKVFAYTTGAKVVALDTFQTIAAAMSHPDTISIGVDAQRGEVVSVVLRRTEEGIEMVKEPMLIAVSDWWKHAELYDNVLFTGPALERWAGKAPPHLALAAESDWLPKASVAGKLAAVRIAAVRIASGLLDDVWSLLPIYSRLSAAEEKRSALY